MQPGRLCCLHLCPCSPNTMFHAAQEPTSNNLRPLCLTAALASIVERTTKKDINVMLQALQGHRSGVLLGGRRNILHKKQTCTVGNPT